MKLSELRDKIVSAIEKFGDVPIALENFWLENSFVAVGDASFETFDGRDDYALLSFDCDKREEE